MQNMTTHTDILTLPDAQIAYSVTGDGYPITFLHAGVADRRLWDAQADFFSQAGYRVIRHDLRGYGDTRTQTKAGFSDAADLLALLDHLNVDRTHLVGMSRGGALAIDFTLAHPERISALIPVAAGLSGFQPAVSEADLAYFKQGEEAEQAGDLDKLNELEVHFWLDGLHRLGDPIDPAARALMLDMNGRALKHPDGMLKPQQADPPAADRLAGIAVPTLVIFGDNDEYGVQQIGMKLIADIPQARYHVFFDGAHMLNLEQPAEFNRIVLTFLRSITV